MRFKASVTRETISDEYIKWIRENGMGRNSQDLRFGQYLVNKYFTGTKPFPELFNCENARTAYGIALDETYYG